MSRLPTFKAGDRVELQGSRILYPDIFAHFLLEIAKGGHPTGTVAAVAIPGGKKSVYPDPLRKMVFVEWDEGRPSGVYRRDVQKIMEENE